MFLSPVHKERYNELLQRDNTRSNDIERQAMFFIFAGNEDLYRKVDYLYDFELHFMIFEGLEKARLSGSEESLVRLAFNLYNNYPIRSITDLFSALDDQNKQLAFNAIKMRFKM
jgi:hypothetical protein